MASAGELFDSEVNVRDAAAAVFAAQGDLMRLRGLLENASAAITTLAREQDVRVTMLAADAIADLSPSDLDEIRAIRTSPPVSPGLRSRR